MYMKGYLCKLSRVVNTPHAKRKKKNGAGKQKDK